MKFWRSETRHFRKNALKKCAWPPKMRTGRSSMSAITCRLFVNSAAAASFCQRAGSFLTVMLTKPSADITILCFPPVRSGKGWQKPQDGERISADSAESRIWNCVKIPYRKTVRFVLLWASALNRILKMSFCAFWSAAGPEILSECLFPIPLP